MRLSTWPPRLRRLAAASWPGTKTVVAAASRSTTRESIPQQLPAQRKENHAAECRRCPTHLAFHGRFLSSVCIRGESMADGLLSGCGDLDGEPTCGQALASRHPVGI